MKCHYDILELTRTADDAEIKKAYRKLALRWHPDKNLDCPELAKDQFQLVQQAYEVLSDPQERAWYDNHREQILRGGHSNYEDNSLDLFQYFTASCYKGFGDDPGGFYSIYAEVFNKIASEDIEYLEKEDDFDVIPKFGNSKTDYETNVRQFYGFWEGYCTKKSYAWLSTHNISEIRDRRILKVIEKENKKIQQKARKERNDEIRSLVSFVRKRDKRVVAYQKVLEERAQKNRLKTEQMRLEQIRRNNEEIAEQQKNSSNVLNEAYEEQLRKLEASYLNSESEDIDEDSNNIDDLTNQMSNVNIVNGNVDEIGVDDLYYDDDLYCVACDKLFKNESSYKNHESSKKHKQNIELLKKEMQKEHNNIATVVNLSESPTNIEDTVENGDNSEIDGNELLEEEQPTTASKKQKNKKSNKTKKKAQTYEQHDDILIENEEVITNKLEDSDDDDWSSSKKSKKSKSKPKEKQPKVTIPVPEVRAADVEDVAKPKIIEDENSVDINHVCVTCNDKFDSKNKLFTHLKKTSHGVYLPRGGAPEKTRGGGKKKK